MPGAARLGDDSKCPADAHGCISCAHCVRGPAVQGSPDVFINGKPALRVGDRGIHKLCCGTNTEGAPTVFINGKPAVRMHDRTVHCGGPGQMVEGSSDVIIGNGQSKLFAEAAKTHAPFVEIGDPAGGNFLKRTKKNLRDYLQERGTENYSRKHRTAASIDAIGEGLVTELPETNAGAAISIANDLAGGNAIKTLNKGGKLAIGKADYFIGKLKGRKIRLKGVTTQRLKYTKRTSEQTAKLRRKFKNTVQKEFIQSIVGDPKKVETIRGAGISEKMIERIKTKGRSPDGWWVHHKLPLDDGGTNDFDNLLLIKNDPYHKAITNAQNAATRKLKPGETIELDFPIPHGILYPTK